MVLWRNGYMHDVSFDFKDDNNMVQKWTYYENGKEAEIASFKFKRAQ